MADLAQPLNSRMPIVNSDGIPTEFFIQWAQQFSQDAASGSDVDVVQAEVDALEATVASLELDDLTDVDVTTTPPTDEQLLSYDDLSGLWVPRTVSGGGGGGSLVFIGEVVAAGGETDLTIGSIASTYRDLFFVFSAHYSAGSGETSIRLNGDTSGVYDAYRHFGGFANSGDQAVNQTRLRIASSNTVANRFVAGEGKVYKYADTGRHKQVTGEATGPDGSSATNGYIVGFGGQWRSTAAVTSISLISLTEPFAAGSHFTVYGRT